ncbi:MAG: hypothetical protein QOI78_9298 [Actinomycetota bacterium]|nr:hypothetical protein [Actinomycetota bacterium]
MRLEAEFTSEPFHGEGSPPEHALAARDAATEAGLDTDFGPLGTLARGDAKALLEALPAITQAALDGGATQVTLQVRLVGAAVDAGAAAEREGRPGGLTGTKVSAAEQRDPTGTRAAEPHLTGDPAGEAHTSGSPADEPHTLGSQAGQPHGADSAPAVELNDALARLIADVERELGASLGELDRPGKQRAVRLLRERGAFGLRKSVSSVADALGVTRFTVYNYLNREAD